MIDGTVLNDDERAVLSEAFAFLGNSLLAPMSQMPAVGLDPAFWAEFPRFGSMKVDDACQQLEGFATAMANVENAVTEVSVEFTRLFVGPPKPAAFPWESYYVAPNVTSGFGEPTYQMQRLLRENGLAVSHGEGSQLADHMGIELLLLSEMCQHETNGEAVDAFVTGHPGSWIDKFQAAAEDAAPSGYYSGLLRLAAALLSM